MLECVCVILVCVCVRACVCMCACVRVYMRACMCVCVFLFLFSLRQLLVSFEVGEFTSQAQTRVDRYKTPIPQRPLKTDKNPFRLHSLFQNHRL